MRSFYSEACLHNQHASCRDQDCQCGCHFIERNGGLTPEEFKSYFSAVKEAEETIER